MIYHTQATLPSHEDLSPGCTAERHLLLLAEALAAAGCPCTSHPPAHQPCLQLAFPSLMLAACRCPWAPEQHSQWPAAFRAAAREFLLVACARGVPVRANLEGKPSTEGAVRPGGAFVSISRKRAEGGAAGARRRRVGRLGALRGKVVVVETETCSRATVLALGSDGRVHTQRRMCLPSEVCCLVLAAAGQRLSDWV